MAIKLVSSSGSVVDPAAINMYASGTVWPNSVVEFSRTGGVGVNIASANSTNTMIFGVCQSYAQGASDTQVNVIPFASGQLWQVDCVAVATTAQIGIKHVLNADALLVRNTGTAVETGKGVFVATAMTGSTSGSGTLIGYFEVIKGVQPDNTSTYS